MNPSAAAPLDSAGLAEQLESVMSVGAVQRDMQAKGKETKGGRKGHGKKRGMAKDEAGPSAIDDTMAMVDAILQPSEYTGPPDPPAAPDPPAPKKKGKEPAPAAAAPPEDAYREISLAETQRELMYKYCAKKAKKAGKRMPPGSSQWSYEELDCLARTLNGEVAAEDYFEMATQATGFGLNFMGRTLTQLSSGRIMAAQAGDLFLKAVERKDPAAERLQDAVERIVIRHLNWFPQSSPVLDLTFGIAGIMLATHLAHVDAANRAAAGARADAAAGEEPPPSAGGGASAK